MLKQIEWRLQNGPTTDPNVNIRIFRKRWSLILGCFFAVSILNIKNEICRRSLIKNVTNYH